MCGICGVVARQAGEGDFSVPVRRMVKSLRHRGPDDSGVWSGPGVALGHARLSILDLSPLGRQPMESPDGQWVLTYNGEIYNYRELRRELQGLGLSFRGESDSEVLLAALQAWGVENTLPRLRGMFAFAAWSRTRQELYLARDFLGQKPLFYGFHAGAFVFGSELRVLAALGQMPPVDPDSAAMMLRYACVPTPFTIYRGIRKLPAASYVVYGSSGSLPTAPHKFWIPPVGSVSGTVSREDVLGLLNQSVQLRMVSDVSVGAFLSGGIDSSLVTALMQRSSEVPVRSFTIAFDDPRYNEAEHARAIAEHLGTDHTEILVTEKQALDIVPRLGEIYDEPFADPSQVPTVLLCRMTRQHVTVALSGDGGDELFRGYNRSIWLPRLERVFRPLPRPLLRFVARCIRSNLVRWLVEKMVDHGLVRTRLVHDKLRKLASLLEAGGFRERYRALLTGWAGSPIVRDVRADFVDEFREVSSSLAVCDQLALVDFLFYLADDILVKVDRASMSTGLEVRAPFLDHHLIALAAGMPFDLNVSQGEGKLVLKRVLADLVPETLFSRPKMGFAAPVRQWLRGPLREWGATLLASSPMSDGFLEPRPVMEAWNELQAGMSDHSQALWNVLMLLSWLQTSRMGAIEVN